MITAKKMTETSAKVSDKVTSKDFYLNNKKTKSNIDSIKSEMKKVVKAFNQIKSITETDKKKVLLNFENNTLKSKFNDLQKKSGDRANYTKDVYQKVFNGYERDLAKCVVPGLAAVGAAADAGLKGIDAADDGAVYGSYTGGSGGTSSNSGGSSGKKPLVDNNNSSRYSKSNTQGSSPSNNQGIVNSKKALVDNNNGNRSGVTNASNYFGKYEGTVENKNSILSGNVKTYAQGNANDFSHQLKSWQVNSNNTSNKYNPFQKK